MELNLDYRRLDIECPQCDFPMRVFLRQVRVHDIVVCGGCKANIRLVDYMGTLQNAIRNTNTALLELERSLKG